MNLAEEAVTDSKTIIEIQSFKNFVFLSNHLILFAKKKEKISEHELSSLSS